MAYRRIVLLVARNFQGVYALAFFFPIIAFAVMNKARRRCFTQIVMDAPMRQKPGQVVLKDMGISAPGARVVGHLCWSAIVSVAKDTCGLLFLTSPNEYVSMQGAGLPVGRTRDHLRAKIAAWPA